jgi:hypothetical protein
MLFMGAHNFETYQSGADLNQAYRDACQEALYESGHDPYNGTISTTGGAVAYQDKAVPETAIQQVINEVWKKMDNGELDYVAKWENCAAIPVADWSRFNWQTHELEVEVSIGKFESPELYFKRNPQLTLELLEKKFNVKNIYLGRINTEVISKEEVSALGEEAPEYQRGRSGFRYNLKLKIDTVDRKQESSTIDGWMFTGWAAS